MGATMREDTELLALEVRRAHAWSGRELPRLGGRGAGAEDPAAVQQMAVDRADACLLPRRHSGQTQDAHAGEECGDLASAQGPLGLDDGPEMLGGPGLR